MRHWIRRHLPTEESVRARASLRWLGPLLRRPWLWHLDRRRVALGAGIGVFFGFLIPVAQIFGAALLALLLRANLPVAAMSTLVSNPLTYAPIFVLAYKTGAWILDDPVDDSRTEALIDGLGSSGEGRESWIDKTRVIGKPLFLGLAVFAVVGGITTWAGVHLLWTVGVWLKRRRRRRAGAGTGGRG